MHMLINISYIEKEREREREREREKCYTLQIRGVVFGYNVKSNHFYFDELLQKYLKIYG
jgi:hypothetical protein